MRNKDKNAKWVGCWLFVILEIRMITKIRQKNWMLDYQSWYQVVYKTKSRKKRNIKIQKIKVLAQGYTPHVVTDKNKKSSNFYVQYYNKKLGIFLLVTITKKVAFLLYLDLYSNSLLYLGLYPIINIVHYYIQNPIKEAKLEIKWILNLFILTNNLKNAFSARFFKKY